MVGFLDFGGRAARRCQIYAHHQGKSIEAFWIVQLLGV